MNKLSTIKGMGQLMIHKNSRGIDLVILAGFCATESQLRLIVYSEIYPILSANDKNPCFIRTDVSC